jgi:hypothetical protein
LDNLSMNVSSTIKWIWNEYNGRKWIGLMCLKIGTIGGLL